MWRDRAEGPRAAEALRITAADCLELKVVHEVVPEALGGAHRHQQQTVADVAKAIRRHLAELAPLDAGALRTDRYEHFRRLGAFTQEKG